MAIYTSDVNRFTGLSGVDTESMVDKMMKAESAKYDKMEKDKTLMEWRQESYRKVIDSMKSFQDKWFGTDKSNNISYDSFWNNYTTSVKDATTGEVSNAIKINGTSDAGSYDIDIKQVAQTATIVGKEVGKDIAADYEKLEKMIEDNGEISFKFNLDGLSKDINITKEELKKAGSLEEAFNQKFDAAFGQGKVVASKSPDGKTISFKPSGNGHGLSISEAGEVKSATKTATGALNSNNNKFTIEIDGYKAVAEFGSDDSEETRLNKIQEALKNAKNTSGETKDLTEQISVSKGKNGDLVIKNASSDSKVTVKIAFNDSELDEGTELNPNSNLGAAGFERYSNVVELNSSLTDVFGKDFLGINEDGTEKDEITLNFGGRDVSITKDDTIQSFINKVNSSDGNIKMSFNDVTRRFEIKSTQSGSNGNIKIDDPSTKDFIKNFANIDVDDLDNNTSHIKGQDAIFSVDGVETTRPSNDVSMGGINFTINGTGHVKIGSEPDVDTTVKKVKEFVDDYNKLIGEVQDLVSKSRPKSGKYEYYEPLSSEQKKAMSEDEVKQWEEKAKTGLLHNDDYLTKFLGDLRDNVYKSVDIGGKSISLFEIGITTTPNYSDGGKLQLDEEKLKEALTTRSDEVRQLFTKSGEGIGELIKQDMNNAIGSKGYLRNKAGIKGTASDANNQLSDEIKDMTEKLAKERERLYNKEMQYFKMFSQMEAAINKQNSQMAALLSATGQ